MSKTKQVAKKEQSMAEVFMTKVITEFTGGDHSIALTQFQRRLAKNYFITLDAVLAKAEAGRLKKAEKWRDKIPVTWDHINMQKLAQDVVAVARIGLDPAQKNHINMIPYKNNTTKQYDIGFIEGYRGIELKSVKYGLDVPDAVIVKLVYSNDKFKSFMKSRSNDCESYDFEIVNDFDRGDVIGGFYYHIYIGNPEKNKLVVMTLEDIEKRKPRYASPEFWGGEKPKWENGKKTGMEPVEGWPKKMQWKTIYRAAYNDITIDSQKIDTDYIRMKEIEGSIAEYEVQAEIDEKANKEFIDIESGEVFDAEFTDKDRDQKGPPPVGANETIPESTQDTQGVPQPPAEKSEPEKSTDMPPEDKRTPGPQAKEEFGEENPIDTALRTGKEEKEQKQAEPKSSPKWVAELSKWLDDVSPEMRLACMTKIREDSFPKLCEGDQDKIVLHYNELQEGSQGQEQQPKREF